MQATGLKKLCSCSEICHCSALPQLQSVSHAVGRKRWPIEDLSPLQFSQLEKFSESISSVKAYLIQIKPNPNNHALVLFVFSYPVACQNLLLIFVLLISRKSQEKVKFYRSIIYLFIYLPIYLF